MTPYAPYIIAYLYVMGGANMLLAVDDWQRINLCRATVVTVLWPFLIFFVWLRAVYEIIDERWSR